MKFKTIKKYKTPLKIFRCIRNLLKTYIKYAVRMILLLSVLFLVMYFIASIPITAKTHMLVNDKTKQVIVIQEMMHVADSSFYKEVNEKVYRYKKIHGFEHMYESLIIKYDEAEEFTRKTGITSDIAKIFQNNSGLAYEGGQLNTEGSTKADITSTEILADIKEKVIDVSPSALEDLKKIETNELPQYIREHISRTTIKFGYRLHKFLNENDINFIISKEFVRVIQDKRNNFVIRKALLSDKDVVITYGANHSDGMLRTLEAIGFRKFDEETTVIIY